MKNITFLSQPKVFLLSILLLLVCSCNEKQKDVGSLPKDLSKPEEDKEYTEHWYVAALSGVNLRTSPDPKSAVIKLLAYSEKLEVVEKTNIESESDGITGRWYKVKHAEDEGFVFSGFLLDFNPPKFVPNGSLEKYLPGSYQSTDEKQAFAITYKEGTYERMLTPVPADKVEIKNEEDAFEIIEKYEGGRFFKEVIGYESSVKTVFLPDLDMREGFLLMKIILPNLHVMEKCNLEMKRIPFPSQNNTLKIFENCEFTVDVKKENNKVSVVKIENTDYAYSGISLTKVEGGVEIMSYISL